MADTSDKQQAPAAAPEIPWLDGFEAFSERYTILLCDIWGVVHNGVARWPDACDALIRFRDRGGKVALITNAPRPAHAVQRLLDRLEVPHDVSDCIVSSGDLTRGEVEKNQSKPVYHLGPERDLSLFEGYDIRRVPPEQAELIVNTGFFDDESETPEDYRSELSECAARGLPMVCANPDLVVERGDRLLYCAGALAELYQELGGSVLWAGKPHAPIYDRALELLGCPDADKADLLAIGDSIRTDMTGAMRYGIDGLYIAGGIHASEVGGNDRDATSKLWQAFADAGVRPVSAMSGLKW